MALAVSVPGVVTLANTTLTAAYVIASPISKLTVGEPAGALFRRFPFTYPLVRETEPPELIVSTFAPVATLFAPSVSAPPTIVLTPRLTPAALFTVTLLNVVLADPATDRLPLAEALNSTV